MDLSSLVAVGLTPLQAQAYALLIEFGDLKPPQAAAKLQTTRSNAYKILDKLVELKLATKTEQGKKIVYAAANPLALASITAQFRAEATAREEAASSIMHDLLARYHAKSDQPDLEVVTGREQVANLYRKQISLREDIYFIHTAADIPMMGFDTMHDIRVTPARYGQHRKGIMAATEETTPINYENHRRSNLEVTWAHENDYNAPVEWSVTESSLMIILYAVEPHAILISDKIVAGAFLQLWRILSSLLSQQATHQALKPKD